MREIAEGVFVADRPLSVFGLRVGTRMTAIRLPDGGLLLHSPVSVDPETRSQLDALGPVRHVVAPNPHHQRFLDDCLGAYPEAQLHAAPSLPAKRPDLRFDSVLGDEAPGALRDEIETCVVAGAPRLGEVVVFHRASRTLLLADLCFNFVECDHAPTRWWLRLIGALGGLRCPRHVRFLIRDRTAARESLERILSWNPERIVVPHGVVLQHSGRRVLREAFEWL